MDFRTDTRFGGNLSITHSLDRFNYILTVVCLFWACVEYIFIKLYHNDFRLRVIDGNIPFVGPDVLLNEALCLVVKYICVFKLIDQENYYCYHYMSSSKRTGWSHMRRTTLKLKHVSKSINQANNRET